MSEIFSQCRTDLEVSVELAQEGLEVEGKTCYDVLTLFARHGLPPFLLDNDYRPRACIHQRRSRPRLVERLTMDETHLADVVFSRQMADTL